MNLETCLLVFFSEINGVLLVLFLREKYFKKITSPPLWSIYRYLSPDGLLFVRTWLQKTPFIATILTFLSLIICLSRVSNRFSSTLLFLDYCDISYLTTVISGLLNSRVKITFVSYILGFLCSLLCQSYKQNFFFFGIFRNPYVT